MAFVQDLYPKYRHIKRSDWQAETVLDTDQRDAGTRFGLAEADELYCGGKAGTGKTDLLIGEAITNS